MRGFRLILLGWAALAATLLQAQNQSQQPPNQEAMIYRQDGGINPVLQSLVVPPKPGAPFTLTLQTEWVQTLSDGGTITLVNERRIARDGRGRIYQERWMLTPRTRREQSRMTMIQISDPASHLTYDCMMDGRHVCETMPYRLSSTVVVNPLGPPPGPLHNGMGYASREGLGENAILGVQTTGVRESVTYDPGALGNDNPMTAGREYWYSPQLGINLLSKRTDPRFGTETFTVSNLTLGEPDPELFELPKGFKAAHLTTRPASAQAGPNGEQ
jgi:hypothetical protein